jgi:thiamine-monophosphate kinase
MPDDPDESFVIEILLSQRVPDAPSMVGSSDIGVGLYAPGDDAAMVTPATCVTVDSMVEGIHWDAKLSAEDVGWKVVAVNASDINAMGAKPTWALLAIALPRPLDRAWVEDFARGMGKALSAWNIHLVGGDTTASPGPRMVSLTLCGDVSTPLGRNGAQVGDDVWVSGSLGGAAAGFYLSDASTSAQAKLRRPQPPIGLGPALVGTASAMMDLSDGLSRDLPRLCSASGVGAEIDSLSIPLDPALTGRMDALDYAVGFGEDYELLFTAPPHSREHVGSVCQSFQRAPARIGVITAGAEAKLKDQPWPPLKFSHFGGEG